jgi:hypothetical protein
VHPPAGLELLGCSSVHSGAARCAKSPSV